MILCAYVLLCSVFFFFNVTATTEIYTLSLHDALPIFSFIKKCPNILPILSDQFHYPEDVVVPLGPGPAPEAPLPREKPSRSEEHTSELQSQSNLVCRLLLEKKKKKYTYPTPMNTQAQL